MLKVLLTGAKGFIGCALHKRLLQLGYEVIIPAGDIAERRTLDFLLEEKFDHIFHLAAKTFVPDSWKYPEEFYNTNVMGTLRVLEVCRDKQIPMTFLSAYIYGVPLLLPISEEALVKPNNPYAHSKYLAEQLCEYYAKYFKVRVNVLRLFNVYGPGQKEHFLIPHVIRQALKEKEIVVKDDTPKRDYVYIDDVIDAIIGISKYEASFEIFNIGSGISSSVKEIIGYVQEIIGTNKPVIVEQVVRCQEIDDVVADLTKIKREINWEPKHSLKSGLTQTIREMRT